MMLRIKKNKWKIGGVALLTLLFCGCYMGMSFYSIPEKASAAVWFPEDNKLTSGTATIKDINYMQEMNKTVCDNSRGITDAVELEDVRDGNKYKVKVLADGKCWMVDNLELDLSIIGIAAADASDNLSADYPNEGLVDRWNTETDNAWVTTRALGQFSKAPAKMNGTSSLQPDSGYFYSWCAATANTCSSATAANSEAPGSICPKGWRLPRSKPGVNVSDFAILAGQSTMNVAASTDNNYWSYGTEKSWNASTIAFGGGTWPASGYTSINGLTNGGTRGYYWSRTAYDSINAHMLSFGDSFFAPVSINDRYIGNSVRCVYDEDILTSQQIDRFAHAETQTVTGAVTVSVANTISIDAVSGTGNIDVDSTKIGIGTISATIVSNTTYRVLLSAAETSLTSGNPANTAEIPASDNVAEGTSAWGIQNSDGVTYTAITTEAHEYSHTHDEGATNSLGKTHEFTVGISVSPTLPADNYSTDVTITAVSF